MPWVNFKKVKKPRKKRAPVRMTPESYKAKIDGWLQARRNHYGRDYSEQQIRVKKLIYLLGGPRDVHKIFNLKNQTTAYKWVERGFIPSRYWQQIVEILGGHLPLNQIAKLFLPAILNKKPVVVDDNDDDTDIINED